MKKAADAGVSWIAIELLDLLWDVNTEDSIADFLKYAKHYSDMGDGNAMGRWARAYRYGRGVESDKSRALELYHSAALLGAKWAYDEIKDMDAGPQPLFKRLSGKLKRH